MGVAITASDGFVGPWIAEMLGEDAIVVPSEALSEPMMLDALLTPCTAVIHINSWAHDAALGRDCLFGVCALFEHETQGPQSGVGARQHEEDQDQHDTSSTWWFVVAEPCLFCGQILQ